MFPSKFWIALNDGAIAVAGRAAVAKELVCTNGAPSNTTKELVIPVRAVAPPAKPFTFEPVLASVLRLNGDDPVEIAVLATEDAQTNIPAAPAVVVFNCVARIACKGTTLTVDVLGFQTPKMGVQLAVSVIVVADSALIE
jgi:hypothetical protein